MEPSRRSAILLLLLLLVTTEVCRGGYQLKQACTKPSGRFRGPCIFQVDCEQQCKKEGFRRGHCTSFGGRCTCIRQGC